MEGNLTIPRRDKAAPSPTVSGLTVGIEERDPGERSPASVRLRGDVWMREMGEVQRWSEHRDDEESMPSRMHVLSHPRQDIHITSSGSEQQYILHHCLSGVYGI